MRADAVIRAIVAVLCVTGLGAGCATRTVPDLPATLKYPEFLVPTVPPALASAQDVERLDAGWRFLQNDQLAAAEREYSRTLSRTPSLYPALTGAGYVALARRDYPRATARFEAALRAAPSYAPALVGRGQALLAAGKPDDALSAFEAAVKADPGLTDVVRRVDVLRLKGLQELIAAARTASAANRDDEARTLYARALAASPDSAFLYRELAAIERRNRDVPAALTHYRRAAELDPSDRESFVQLGELLEEGQDFSGAEGAYRRAAELEPGVEIDARVSRAAERARDERLPAEFRAIATSERVTRGDLAALIGVRLDGVLDQAPERQVVVTDADRHWAAPWITRVTRAGIIEVFENHTFQPTAPVRRVDIAEAVRQVAQLVARDRPDLRARLADRPRVADMAPNHLSYPAVAAAVSSGIMSLTPTGQFDPNRPVSGADAIDVVDRLRQLARTSR